MIVSVIGLGYIGLPTAALLASNGMHVIGVDVNESVVNTINQGMIHIVEPGLSDFVKKSVSGVLVQNKPLFGKNFGQPKPLSSQSS